jgi:hypothetical protein
MLAITPLMALPRAGLELTMLVVKGTDCIGCCKFTRWGKITSLCMKELVFSLSSRGRGGHDRMVVGFTTTYAISAFHH